MQLNFRSLAEDRPGMAWRSVFDHGWPGWSEWFHQRRKGEGPSLSESRRAVRGHMPEYEPLWDRLAEACGGDEDAAQFLSFWSPPRYLVNCSQAVHVGPDGPVLIRNYDLAPDLNESTLLSTAWRGRRVVGMVEGMAGLADGMNQSGLAVSLTFGGRVVAERGFGIPLILRYVLETCNDTAEAIEALRAVPSHMSYNITLIDASGDWATVFVAPDRPTMVRHQPWATNHQLAPEWPRHARLSNTVGRGEHLEALLSRPGLTLAALEEEFLRAPLFSTRYDAGFGTVYTAIYQPGRGEVTLAWGDGSRESWRLDAVGERQRPITYGPAGSATSASTIIPPPTDAAWYDEFRRHAGALAADPDGSVRALLAGFWRRMHDPHDSQPEQPGAAQQISKEA